MFDDSFLTYCRQGRCTTQRAELFLDLIHNFGYKPCVGNGVYLLGVILITLQDANPDFAYLEPDAKIFVEQESVRCGSW